jgi:ribosomal protein S27E
VQIDADYQRRQLTSQMEELQARFAQARAMIDADMGQADAALTLIEGQTENLDKSASTVISSLQGMYDGLQDRLAKVEGDIRKAESVLGQVDNASFKLYPQENVIDAMAGQWITDQKGGPKGILFCTDHRLIFEQNEEVATKRVLFVVTEKKKVQQLALEAPIGSVQEVKESESGALIFRKDHLELTFGAASTVRFAHFILKGDSAEWQRLINRVNGGEMEKERVKAEDKPKQLPTQCPACGGRFTQTIVRGMTNVKCQYCGTVVQL